MKNFFIGLSRENGGLMSEFRNNGLTSSSEAIYRVMTRSGCERVVEADLPFCKLEEMLDEAFLDDVNRELLRTCLHEVQTAMICVISSLADKADFMEKGERYLCAYLDRYMELLHQLLANWEVIQQSLDYKVFFQSILNLGCVFSGTEVCGVGKMTPLAPPYVAALLEFGRECDNLEDMIEKKKLSTDMLHKLVTDICNEVLDAHMYRYMRWFTVSPEGALCHIALHPFSKDRFERKQVNLPIVPISEYGSYERIDELRLLEKIHYELEQKQVIPSGESERTVFRVLIVGGTDMDKIRLVRRALSGWLEKNENCINWLTNPQKLKLHFTLLTRTQENTESCEGLDSTDGRVVFCRKNYTAFFANKNEFSSLAKTSDLLFFLDCKKLYNRLEVKPAKDLSTFLQWPQVENYTALRLRLDRSNASFLPGNKFFKMRELLVGTVYSGTPGYFSKKINPRFLQTLERCIKDCDGNFQRTAYVCYSDLYAAEMLDSSERQIVRMERYSGKKFAVLRMGKGMTEN